MPVANSSSLTVEDYRKLPDGGPRFQLVEGELYMSPAPNRYHQAISRNIEFMLLKYLEHDPRGELYHAPFDVYLSEHDVFQPDIVFVARENFSILVDAGVEGTPDLVIEILSPSNAYLDRKAKLRVYARTGVKELWIVDPEARRVEVYHLPRNSDTPAIVCGENESFASSFFPGLDIQVATIFKRHT